MSHDPALPEAAFDKHDTAPDELFYAQPRFVTHIDVDAIGAVTALYRELLPASGIILDLMSSWVSHLPEEAVYGEVIGHGMNEQELAANPRFNRYFVQNLNANASLPLHDASIDAAAICVSIQYLQNPIGVLREIARVLKPGGPLAITFSNRCFPTKAVAIWQALADEDHQRLVLFYLAQAGFESQEARILRAPHRGHDPLWAVIGRTGGSAQ
jgi:SAM-dependent methyltransferase